MTNFNTEQTGVAMAETQPRDKGGWARALSWIALMSRVLTWIALIFSVVLSVAYFTVNVWLDAELGTVDAINAEVGYVVLVWFALLLDLVVIGLTSVAVEKKYRRRYLIVGVIALVVLVGPIAVNIIRSAVMTNG
jgi:hypothetical protein